MKTVSIKGMSCAHCVGATKKELENLGLKNVSVQLETNSATFTEDENITEEAIKKAVETAGFEIE